MKTPVIHALSEVSGKWYVGCPVNFEPEQVAQHSAIWLTYKVHIHVDWFGTRRKSAERDLYNE